jgi:hypothetical protein
MRKSILSNIENRLQAAKAMPIQDFDLELASRRKSERMPTYLFGLAVTDDGGEEKCIVEDLSDNGASLSTGAIEVFPNEFTLVIDGYAAPTRVRLIWRNDSIGGVEFIKTPNN